MPYLTPDFGCAAVRDALPDLLHGRLAGDARLRAGRHVAECAGCAAELALLRGARAAVHAGAPAIDVAAVAAAVRAATVPAGGARQPARPALEVSRPVPPRLAAPSRWRAGRPLRALAATVLVAVGAGVAWFGGVGEGSGDGARSARDTAGAVARAPVAVAGGSAGPAVLASAEPGLGARFDDLTDEELQAVIAAVEGSDQTLPDEELAPAAPELDGGA